MEIINAIGSVSSNKLTPLINKSQKSKLWAKPVKFPTTEKSDITSLPNEDTVFVSRGDKIWQTWIRILYNISKFGRVSPMIHHYGSERINELFNLSAVVYNESPDFAEIPDWFPYKKPDVKDYIKNFLSFSRGDEDYTYGERIKAYPLDGYADKFLKHLDDKGEFQKILTKALSGRKLNQQKIMAEKLKSFRENKGAIAVLWEPLIDNFGLRNNWRTPCMVLVQAIIRDKKLYLTAYFRSNDMFGGWPLNAFGLLAFQKELIDMVDKKLTLGPLITISHSAQIYETCWPAAEKIVKDHFVDVSCEWDKRGNLDIAVNGKYIVVKHFSPEGVFINKYSIDGTKPYASRHLCFQLEKAGLFSTIGNAMYVGRNIERAVTAVKLGLSYVSDQPLDFKKYIKN